MDHNNIELFILMNEPSFVINGTQYSVCCPRTGVFSTWDSNENTHDYSGIDSLLDEWMIEGRPFREVVPTLI